uniref:Uncharacterized protein n=1 Tax=Brassica oleracea var. oleracea TaxID=109376 RepID=A0A0D3A9L7_BRAOL
MRFSDFGEKCGVFPVLAGKCIFPVLAGKFCFPVLAGKFVFPVLAGKFCFPVLAEKLHFSSFGGKVRFSGFGGNIFTQMDHLGEQTNRAIVIGIGGEHMEARRMKIPSIAMIN